MNIQLEKYRWRITSAFSVLITCCVLMLFLLPAFSDIIDQYRHIQLQKERIVSAQNWEHILAEYNKQQEHFDAFYSNLTTGISRDDQMSGIIELIYRKAHESGVDIRQLRPGEIIRYDTFTEIPVSISAEGNFHELALLINGFEQTSYLVRLSALDIQSVNDLNSTRLLSQLEFVFIILQNQM